MPPKVRLVTCPKCRNVLPESADVPVYKCGGCDTILQAKYRKNDARNVRSDSMEVTDASTDELVKGLKEKKEPDNVVKEIVIPSSEEYSLDMGNVKEQDVSTNASSDEDSRIQNKFSNTDEEGHEVPNGITSLPELVGEANRVEPTIGEISPVARAESREETNNSDLNVEKQEKPQSGVPHMRTMSDETFASTEYVDPCSEFSGTVVGDSFRSPTIMRGHRHAYDASISSLDAPAEEFHNLDRSRGKEHSRNDQENSGFPRERLRKNKFVSSEMLKTSASGFGGRYGGELPPRIPVHKRAPRFMSEDEGSSDRASHGFSSHSWGYHLSRSPEELVEEDDKMRLLKIVYELEDQLKKACNLNRIDGRKSRATYYSHELPEEEGPVDLNFLRPNPWARNFRSSRIPFSAETTRTAHLLDHSHWGHFLRPRQRSEPLPPPPFHHSRTRNAERNFYGPYSSWPSSPQQYMGSEFSTGSHDPGYELQKLRKYYRERGDHSLKRHLRPIGGAAPFMSCYHCSAIIQLPEDSLVFRKRCHRVRCGGCSTVLKFLLENGTCVAPYEPEAQGPPPSEVEDYDNSVDVRKLYAASNAGEIDEGRYSPMRPGDIRNSPLHALMGYSSVSQVFKGYGPSAKRLTSSARKSP